VPGPRLPEVTVELRPPLSLDACFSPGETYPDGMKKSLLYLLVLAGAAVGLSGVLAGAQVSTNEFSKPVIDIGLVARDAARTARFLTETIGFKEVKGFSVTAELGRKIGLIDGQAVEVRVFVQEDVERATRIKLLSFPGAPGKQPDQSTIHATLGIRYLTLYVKDMNRALERIKKTGVKCEGETPYALGNNTLLTVVKDPDGNFIELIGPGQKP
jgi:catechol 2,3-dioxygenase-like lactoylglutathione lyase family enzyme